ncbi:MAG: sulfite exporter TauE/SafE family protein [Candidatus Riflebacteria bacterium]|nr:sulfite exporter TauE/SafE family protein [Candidatus Riflebacteria bacterium]
MIFEATFLGFSSGPACFLTCAPTIFPFLAGQKDNLGKNCWLNLLLFLTGRLISYLLLGTAIGILGSEFFGKTSLDIQFLVRYLLHNLIGILLLWSGMGLAFPEQRFCKVLGEWYNPKTWALVLGFFSGFSFCPPLIAASTQVFSEGTIFGGIGYFFFFFIGTTVFFVPVAFFSTLAAGKESITMISRLTMIIVGLYFLLF